MQRALRLFRAEEQFGSSDKVELALFTKKGEVDRSCSAGRGNMFCQVGEVCRGFPAYQIGLEEAQLIKLTIPSSYV
jgi:hypothetical protein